MQQNVKYRAWSSFAGATAINLTMGLNYSWSVIKKALVTDWHWTNVEAALPYTVYTAVYAFSMAIAGRMQDKFGPRLVAKLGALVLLIGMIACSYSTTPLALAISYGLLISIGYSMCYATTIPASVKWFPPEKKGLITGVVVSATGLAAFFMAPIANWALINYGIADTFLFLGMGIVSVIFVSAQLLSTPSQQYDVIDKPAPMLITKPTSPDLNWQEMLKTPSFYKLWLMYFFASSPGLMIFGHITTIAKVQASLENSFYLVSLLSLFNTFGRLLSGILSDKFGRITIMKMVFCLQIVNLILFSSYLNTTLLAVGVMFFGLCYGACFSLFPLIVSDFYGNKNFGVNYGLILTAWGLSGALGPLLAAWTLDGTGTYSLAYIISAALVLVSLLLSFIIKAPQRQLHT